MGSARIEGIVGISSPYYVVDVERLEDVLAGVGGGLRVDGAVGEGKHVQRVVGRELFDVGAVTAAVRTVRAVPAG
jgi:hypothetical protein